mmetsp:Transcript_19990/g.63267  ORF Transcript_19990/g.63267 Transcript_19990/m.63267 type:complete len:204 (-) Transcript_19990:107-718(-)
MSAGLSRSSRSPTVVPPVPLPGTMLWLRMRSLQPFPGHGTSHFGAPSHAQPIPETLLSRPPGRPSPAEMRMPRRPCLQRGPSRASRPPANSSLARPNLPSAPSPGPARALAEPALPHQQPAAGRARRPALPRRPSEPQQSLPRRRQECQSHPMSTARSAPPPAELHQGQPRGLARRWHPRWTATSLRWAPCSAHQLQSRRRGT